MRLLVIAMMLAAALSFPLEAMAAAKTVKFSYIQNEGDQMDVIAKKAKAYIETKTNGRYKIDLLCCQKMGSEEAMGTAIRTGIIQMMIVSAPGQLDPMMNMTGVPYTIKDKKHFYDVYEGPVGKEIADHFGKVAGFTPVYWFYRIHQMIFTTKPLTKPEDWAKFKIRAASNFAYTSQLDAMNARVVPMPFPEVYMALKTGVIDGVQTVMDWFVSFKLYEVCKYAIDIKHDFSPVGVYLNNKFMDSLSPEDRKIFIEAFSSQRDDNEKWVEENHKRYYDKMVAEGVKVTEASPEDIATYKKMCWDYLRKNADRCGGPEIMEKMFKTGGY